MEKHKASILHLFFVMEKLKLSNLRIINKILKRGETNIRLKAFGALVPAAYYYRYVPADSLCQNNQNNTHFFQNNFSTDIFMEISFVFQS